MFLLIPLCLFAGTLASFIGIQASRFDLVIDPVVVVHGSGAARRRADVGIRNGRIVAIGALSRASAAETIDAANLIVAPGFVDVHTHADDLAQVPQAENFVRMGISRRR